jgi:hypothetical protein
MRPGITLLLVLLALNVAVVAVISGRSRGRRAAPLVAALFLPLPLLAEGSGLYRALISASFLMCFLRSLDLARAMPAGWSAWRRALHLVAIVDTRSAGRCVPALDRRQLAMAGINLGIASGAIMVVMRAELPASARWIVAGIAIVAAFEFVSRAIVSVAAWQGVSVPDVSRSPQLAQSLAEFWGVRWNRVIGGLLREHCFTPLARRPSVGLAWAFVVSGVAHVYLLLPALDVMSAATMGAFFLTQPPLMLMERRLKVRRWPVPARRAWTLAALALTFPLFVVPALALFGITTPLR